MMALEQKLKRVTLEIALKHSLGLGKKSPERTARNLLELAESISGTALPKEEQEQNCRKLTQLVQEGDTDRLICYLTQVCRLQDEG